MNFLDKPSMVSAATYLLKPLFNILRQIILELGYDFFPLITLCDWSKAFDSVSHDILINRCIKFNVDSFRCDSYEYLDLGMDSVCFNDFMQNKFDISYGVRQGSVLGHILFTIYVNVLSDFISSCDVIQYADDTHFIHTYLIHRGEVTLREAKLY